MLCIQPGEHGSTYGGYAVVFPPFRQAPDLLTNLRNPLGCAVAMTALSVLIDERLADRAMRLGEYFRSSIRALNSPLVKEVRGRGLLNAVVIDEDSSKKHGKGRTAWQFCLLLKSRGVLAKPTHVNMYALIFTVISNRSLRWFPASASPPLSSLKRRTSRKPSKSSESV